MNGGVLIIGSLFWDDDRNPNDNIRKDWRDGRLDNKNAIRVKLPIRYGRNSKGGEFTMVYSANLEKNKNLGIGYVVPFLNNPIEKYKQLEDEAIEIAKAEALGNMNSPKFFTSWGGALGLLFNEKKTNKENLEKFYNEWKLRFNTDKGNKSDRDFCVKGERSSIRNGKLQIDWPICVDNREQAKLNKLDFIIGASNKPKYSLNGENEVYKYPNIKEIALNHSNDKKRYYFLRNIQNGIMTYQDFKILNEMT
jgi:hypothetical protein